MAKVADLLSTHCADCGDCLKLPCEKMRGVCDNCELTHFESKSGEFWSLRESFYEEREPVSYF